MSPQFWATSQVLTDWQWCMARVHQRGPVPGSLHLVPSRRLFQQPHREEKDCCDRILLASARYNTPNGSSEPNYVCPRQVVHWWCLSILLDCPCLDDRVRVSHPQRHRYILLQLRLVCWRPDSSVGHIRNSQLLWLLGMANPLPSSDRSSLRGGLRPFHVPRESTLADLRWPQ